MIISNAVCVLISKESEHHHSIGSPMDEAQPRPKTERDNLIKDNLGCYCPKMISIRLWTWVSLVHWAPYAVMLLRFFRNPNTHSNYISPVNSNHLEQSNIRKKKRGANKKNQPTCADKAIYRCFLQYPSLCSRSYRPLKGSNRTSQLIHYIYVYIGENLLNVSCLSAAITRKRLKLQFWHYVM